MTTERIPVIFDVMTDSVVLAGFVELGMGMPDKNGIVQFFWLDSYTWGRTEHLETFRSQRGQFRSRFKTIHLFGFVNDIFIYPS